MASEVLRTGHRSDLTCRAIVWGAISHHGGVNGGNLTLLAGRIEPVIDFETREPRADANGKLIYGVGVVAGPRRE